ncbi:MAG TPA: alpha/beta hydrolase [Bryobacteraceae bacterium]|nr:alpha/beta hydrolase [Bryobacteraceae bacterium]
MASACGGLYFLANRAIYYPMKYPQGLWELKDGLGAADVWIETPDHVRLHGWLVRREGAHFVTLYLHGNAGNVTHRAAQIREIAAAGSSILMLDYRGYGRSEGWPTEKGLYRDSEAAFAYLLGMGYRGGQIILHGESLGTAVAIDLASRRPCAALVLEAPFTSASDVAGTVLPVVGPLLVRSFNSVSKIRWIVPPKLFMQGDRDEIIPPRFAQELFRAAQARKEFWVVEGAHHNDILETAGASYREKLREFYASLVK